MQFPSCLFPLALIGLSAAMALPEEDKSKIPCEGGPTQRQAVPIGNGNPHQNFIFKQISGSTDCTDNPSGSVSITKGLTVGWSASAGFTSDFITGGFTVTESVNTGSTNDFGCKTNSGSHNGSLCVFERIQVTAFTAKSRECEATSCGTHCSNYDQQGTIFAPNSQQGSCYYDNFQVNLACDIQGTEHHIDMGPAGGPQFIACDPTQA